MLNSIDQCRSCGSKEIIGFFDLGDQPFANSLTKVKTDNYQSYPLSLSWCRNCELVQLNHTAKPTDLFSEYVWVTGTSSTARKYSNRFCEDLLSQAEFDRDSGYILELASNDGTFLRPFIDKGFKVLGVDPAGNIAEKANSEGISTKCGFFGEPLAKEIISEHGKPKILFARNVLPHVANLRDFVKGIECCSDSDTLIAIEIHYSKKILEELHYDSIYHEHLCYFSAKSIGNLLKSFDLHIYRITESPISGGSLVFYITKGNRNPESSVKKYLDSERTAGINDLASWQEFANRSIKHRQSMRDIIDDQKSRSRVIAGYGASARSSTLLNFCGIDSNDITFIADQNPLKTGLFTPGTGIEIKSPPEVMATNPDTILLLAWNFEKEIRQILSDKYNFKGELIIPLPYSPETVKPGE